MINVVNLFHASNHSWGTLSKHHQNRNNKIISNRLSKIQMAILNLSISFQVFEFDFEKYIIEPDKRVL